MKKAVSAFLCVFLCVIMSSCGIIVKEKGQGAKVENGETKKETVQEIKRGDKIVTDGMEITINGVEITYDVLPDKTDGFYTHYPADSGKVYISVDADVTNKAKQDLGCDEIGKLVADYNDGYTYKGFVVVEDSTTGFTYANITKITPLETKGIKWLVECPEAVGEGDEALFLEFTVEGENFVYTVR